MTEDYGFRRPPAFCSRCAGPLSERLLETEDRSRLVCEACGHVHYLNPRPVAGVIVHRAGRVLLARRGIEPRYGAWTFPGGFVEMDERVEETAVREAREEVGLDVDLGPLLGVYTRPDAGIVLVVYVSAGFRGEPVTTRETLETAWFHHADIPWDGLAFETTAAALRDWVARFVPEP
jgi:ADP-ribose pyrophosphatase YjhB (NUDIX family)